MITYQQNRFGSGGDLVIQRRQLVQPIQDQVFNIVQEVAEGKKYDFIFDHGRYFDFPGYGVAGNAKLTTAFDWWDRYLALYVW